MIFLIAISLFVAFEGLGFFISRLVFSKDLCYFPLLFMLEKLLIVKHCFGCCEYGEKRNNCNIGCSLWKIMVV